MPSNRNSGADGHREGADNRRPALRKSTKCVFPEKQHENLLRHEFQQDWIEDEYISIRKPISHHEDAQPIFREPEWPPRGHPSIDESIPTYSSISMRYDAGCPSPFTRRLSSKPSIRRSTCTQSSVSTVFTEAREDQNDESDIDTTFSSSIPGAFPYTPNSPLASRVARDFSDTSILYPTVYTPPLPQQYRKLSSVTSPRTPDLTPRKSVPSILPSEADISPPPKAPLPPLPSYRERTTRPETPLSASSRHRDGSGASSSRLRERSEAPSHRRPETPLSITSIKVSAFSQSGNVNTSTTVQSASKQNYERKKSYEHEEEPSEYQIFLAQSISAQNRPPLLRTQNLPVLQLHIPQYPPTPCETPKTSRALDEITSAHYRRARSGSTSTTNTGHTPRQHLAQPKLPSAQAHLFCHDKFPVNLKEQLHGGQKQMNPPVRPGMVRTHSDTNRQTPITPQVSRFSTDTYNTYQANIYSDSGPSNMSQSSFTSMMRSILPFARTPTPSSQHRDIKVCGRAITPVSSTVGPASFPTELHIISSPHTHSAFREPPSRDPLVPESKDRDQERGRSSSRWSSIGKAVKRSLSLDRDSKRNVLRKNDRDHSLSRSDQEGLARRGGAFGESKGHSRAYSSVSASSSVGRRDTHGDGLEDRKSHSRSHSRVMPTSKALARYNSNVDGMV